MRSATQLYCNTVEYGCVSLRMRFFPQNFGTMKRILPGSSSPSHREGPGIEVEASFALVWIRPWCERSGETLFLVPFSNRAGIV